MVPINQQSSTATQAIVEVCGVKKAFGRNNVLKDVSLRIEEGRSMALVGRNGAGKSTLVGVLTGLLMPDGGVVNFGAAPAPSLHNRAAWRWNVACVYQHSTVVPTLTVAENLLLNQQPRAVGGRIDWRAMRRQAIDALSEWDIDVDVTAEAHTLSVEQRQIVEIARALLQGARFIILDEPTAHLDKRAVDRLFARIRKLQKGGISFLFISHYLEEIYEICHDVTVMRDGRVIVTRPLNEMSKAEVVAAMVGDTGQLVQIKAGPAYRTENLGQPLLSVRGLTIGQTVSDVSFDLNAGECLGLTGLANSGKIEIGDVLAGLVSPDAGGAKLDGKALPFGSVATARRAGIGFVPNDRRHRGIIPQLSLAENLILTITDRLGPLGIILPALRDGIARTMIAEMGVVASSPGQPIVELSGGNQQKAVMARALSSLPRILVLVCPTQGVDIASKAALFRIVESVRMTGTGVLIISDDLDDLYICQRTLVMFRGRISGEFTAGWVERDLVSAIEGVHENA